MLRRLYNWTLRLSAHPKALPALGAVSFVESSVFPIPPDVMLVPMVIAERRRAFLYAFVCTVTSVLGAYLGYVLGAFFYDEVGRPVLALYGYTDKFEAFRATYNDWGAWAVLIAGVTPFPYKVITILSGATGLDLVVFTVASLIARSLRFYAVAGLLWLFGPPIRDFIERRLGLVFGAFCLLLVGGFVVARYLL